MNVTISGYVSFVCSSCSKPHNIEAQALMFKEDTSPESEEDEYIRYISQHDTVCASCGNEILISFDTWEYPEAISNYSYYSEVGVNDIECEFTIEHYFDETIAKIENTQHEYGVENGGSNENEIDEEERFSETQSIEGYTDQYDDTE